MSSRIHWAENMPRSTKAICINCGAEKEAYWYVCSGCALEPKDENGVKSEYCSQECFEKDGKEAKAGYGLELVEMAAAIRRGEEIKYDEVELERIRREHNEEIVKPTRAVMFMLGFTVFVVVGFSCILVVMLVAMLFGFH